MPDLTLSPDYDSLPKLLTIDQVIELTTIPESVIRRDLKSGRLRGCRFSKTVILFRAQDIQAWLSSYAEPARVAP